MLQRLVFAALLVFSVAAASCGKRLTMESPAIVGAWRSTVQFTSGPFAEAKDLEFMYAFNAGGTMMESSNYDAMPPVPPAYGTWRPVGMDEYELRYEYFVTKPPADVASIPGGGGWLPNGRGVLTERIKLSADRQSFTSKLSFQMLDAAGKPVEGGGEAEGKGVRMGQ
jgi:hypothetical protein